MLLIPYLIEDAWVYISHKLKAFTWMLLRLFIGYVWSHKVVFEIYVLIIFKLIFKCEKLLFFIVVTYLSEVFFQVYFIIKEKIFTKLGNFFKRKWFSLLCNVFRKVLQNVLMIKLIVFFCFIMTEINLTKISVINLPHFFNKNSKLICIPLILIFWIDFDKFTEIDFSFTFFV